MAKRLPLDTRFAIADAFDSGMLRGECSVNEIADAVSASRKSIGRTLKVIGFKEVQKRRPLTEKIPSRWAPPRKWPTLKRHHPTAEAIMLLYSSGQWSGRYYVRDLAPILGVTEKTVRQALERLKFKVVKRAHTKQIGVQPAVWAPPPVWPELFQKQRELHRSGLSTSAVMRTTDLSAELTAIIDDAVKLLDVAEIPLYARGEMKLKIRKVVQDVYRKATFDSIARHELAGWLGERDDANVQYLESRVRGYVRFASRKTCPECGHNPTSERSTHRVA